MPFDIITQTFTDIPSRQINCWCGVPFAVPQSLFDEYHRKNAVRSGSMELHCPLGHGMVPAGRSEADRLRDELAREKHRTEQARAEAEHHRRQMAAQKGQVTKLRNRVGRGVCPCCNRYFADLHRHMQGKHPGWRPEAEVSAEAQG